MHPGDAAMRRPAAQPGIAAFVAALPKVELHVHLVGSASWETVLTLARRHPEVGVPTGRDALRRCYEFTGFEHFLRVFGRINRLVRTADDVETLVRGLARDLAACTVRYAEVQVTPLAHLAAGASAESLARGLVEGRVQARDRYGVELGWVFDADGSAGPAAAQRTVDFALDLRPAGTVAVGLGGPERGVSRAGFAAAFRRARDAGLHSVPHAGETVGSGEVWAAVRELGAERIGHGLGAARDRRLLAYLTDRGVALEVCPTSNIRTGAVPSLAAHPLPALLNAGVPVTLGTDDPGMFGTDLDGEYLTCHRAFGLGAAELADLARSGARTAFCPPALRDRILAEIDAVEAAHGRRSGTVA